MNTAKARNKLSWTIRSPRAKHQRNTSSIVTVRNNTRKLANFVPNNTRSLKTKVGRYTERGENRLAWVLETQRAKQRRLNRTKRIRKSYTSKSGSMVGTTSSNNRGDIIHDSYISNSESLGAIPSNNRGELIQNSYLSDSESMVVGTVPHNNRGELIQNSYVSNSNSIDGIPSNNNYRGIVANSYYPNNESVTRVTNSGTHTTMEGVSSSGSNIHPYPYTDRLTKNEANVFMKLLTEYNSYNTMRNMLLEMNIPEKSKQKLLRRTFHVFGNNI